MINRFLCLSESEKPRPICTVLFTVVPLAFPFIKNKASMISYVRVLCLMSISESCSSFPNISPRVPPSIDLKILL